MSLNGKANTPLNGRTLLPVKLGITDECQHVNHEIKVKFARCKKLVNSLRHCNEVFFCQLYHSEENKTTMIQHDIELTKEIVNLFQTGVLRHNFNFLSAYQNPENFVSTFHQRWVLVDYMFYTNGTKNGTQSSAELKLLGYHALPSAQSCESINLRIPNAYLGSDHLSLAAKFFLTSNANTSNAPSTSTKL